MRRLSLGQTGPGIRLALSPISAPRWVFEVTPNLFLDRTRSLTTVGPNRAAITPPFSGVPPYIPTSGSTLPGDGGGALGRLNLPAWRYPGPRRRSTSPWPECPPVLEQRQASG